LDGIEKSNQRVINMEFKITVIDSATASRVLGNDTLNRYLVNKGFFRTNDFKSLIELTVEGSVVFTTENRGDDYLLLAGVHGNELASQAALTRLLYELYSDKYSLNHTLHIIPFLIPVSTSKNTRNYNGLDMNRNAFVDGPTKAVVDYGVNVGIKALCDCHSTDPSLQPGENSVFCSFRPLKESYFLAKHIADRTNSKLLPISRAGSVLNGAIEDEANLRGIPSVTCEALEVNGKISDKSVLTSYNQVMSFLDYFDIIKR
jgi:predicted deacylase